MDGGYIWNRIKAVPAGVWAALGVALSLFFMYLRGRRLEAELAAEKLKTHAADAAAKSARSEGKAQVHLEAAAKHEHRVEELQDKVIEVGQLGKKEQARIEAMPPSKVTSEYLKLATQEKVRGSDDR
jgi:uncharacterized protein YdaU (DUF1376 family)